MKTYCGWWQQKARVASGVNMLVRAFKISRRAETCSSTLLPRSRYIDEQGRGCLYNVVDFDVKQGVMSWVLPQLYDKNSKKLTDVPVSAAAATAASATARGDWGVMEAVHSRSTGC